MRERAAVFVFVCICIYVYIIYLQDYYDEDGSSAGREGIPRARARDVRVSFNWL